MKLQRRFASWAVIAVMLALSACGGDDDPPAQQTAEFAEGSLTSVFNLKEGSCVKSLFPLKERKTEVVVVDCEEEGETVHEAEVFAVFDLPAPDGAPFPGDDAVRTQSQDGCRDRFSTYVGVRPDDDIGLETTFIAPSQKTWEDRDLQDRQVVCLALTADRSGLKDTVREKVGKGEAVVTLELESAQVPPEVLRAEQRVNVVLTDKLAGDKPTVLAKRASVYGVRHAKNGKTLLSLKLDEDDANRVAAAAPDSIRIVLVGGG